MGLSRMTLLADWSQRRAVATPSRNAKIAELRRCCARGARRGIGIGAVSVRARHRQGREAPKRHGVRAAARRRVGLVGRPGAIAHECPRSMHR